MMLSPRLGCISNIEHQEIKGLGEEENMPRLDENTPQYLQDAEQGVRARTARAWDSFTNFALRDNVLEVAVGLM